MKKMQMLDGEFLLLLLTVGALPAEGPGVQQAAECLEQVRPYWSTC